MIRKPQPARRTPLIVGGAVAAGILVVGLIVWITVGSGRSNNDGQPLQADTNSDPTPLPPGGTSGASTAATEPAAGTDYASARMQFRTRLTRQDKSPQPGEPVVAPPGAALMSYTSGELQLQAILGLPQGPGQHPAVIFLHGGFAYGDADWEMSQPFLDAGFAVMTPILRGENQQPGYFSLYYDEVNDVLAALDVLTQNPQIDPDRIFIAGHSAGGTLATLCCMASPRFRAAASFSGTMFVNTGIYGQPALVVFDPMDENELRMRSPLLFANSFKCPARLFHGNEETYFDLETGETAARAKSLSLDVEHVIVPGDHFSSVSPAMTITLDFFRSML